MSNGNFTSQQVVDKLMERAPQFGVDPALAKAIFIAENSKAGEWNPHRVVSLHTVSKAIGAGSGGAVGVMQVMPNTHAGLIQAGYIPATNRMSTLDEQVDAGLAAIKDIQRSIGSTDPVETAVKYNTSWSYFNAWKSAGKDASKLMPETQGYIPKVLAGLGQQAPAAVNGARAMVQVPQPTNMIPGLQQAADAQSALAGSTMEVLRAILGQSEAAATKMAEATAQQASGAASLATAKAAAGNAQDAQIRAITAAVGGDLTDPNSAASKARSEMQAAAGASSKLEAEINQLQGLDPLKDPLGWLVGQFKLNAVGKQWDVAKAQEQRAHSTLNAIQSDAANQLRMQPANLEESRKQIALAEASIASGKAQEEALRVEAQVRAEQINLAKTGLMIGGDQLTNKMQLARMQADYEHHLAALAERTKKDVNLVRANETITAGYFGRAFETLADVKAMGAEAEDRMARANRGAGVYASSVGEYVANLHSFGNLAELRKANPAMGVVVSVLKQKADDRLAAIAASKNPLEQEHIAKLSPTQRLEWAVNEQWKEWKAEAAKKPMNQLSAENPWRADTSAMALSPELASNSFAKYVTDRMKSGGQAPDEKELFAEAASRAKAGNAEQAVRELHAFFTAGMKHQMATQGFVKMGADMADPDRKNFTGEFRYRALIGGQTLNAMNLGEIQAALVRVSKQADVVPRGPFGAGLIQELAKGMIPGVRAGVDAVSSLQEIGKGNNTVEADIAALKQRLATDPDFANRFYGR